MSLGWDIAAVQTGLKAWADAASGITFVMAGHHAAPPAIPYGTIQILSGPVSGYANGQEHVYDSDDDSIEFRSRNIGIMSVRFQAFSQSQTGTTSARAYLERLVGSIGLISSLDVFNALGLSPHSCPPVTDLSDIADNNVRGRASLDVDFNVGVQATETISYIASIDGEGTITSPGDAEISLEL